MTTEEINVVVKDVKTVESVLSPTIYVSWVLGVGIARPGNRPKTTTFIHFVHFSMCSIIVAYGVIDFFTIGKQLPSAMFKIMYYMNKAICYVTSYYYVLLGYLHYKKWPKLLEKIITLDKKIRRETVINDRPIVVKQIVAFMIIILLGPMSLISHVVYYYFTNPKNLLASDVLLYYTFTQSLATTFVFDIIVLIIYQRFKVVNKLIKQIGDVNTASWIVLKIQRLRELHHGICDIVTYVNGIYGIHLLLSSANSFMMVVATLFRIYIGLVDLSSDFIMANNVIWLTYAFEFALMCCICTITCREASRTGVLINAVALKNNQISNKRLYSNNMGNRRALSYQPESKTYEGACIQNEILHFSSQLQQEKVAFSACDFFELNNALLQGFISVITTYLIILIQFYEPPRQVTETVLDFATNSTQNSTDGILNDY